MKRLLADTHIGLTHQVLLHRSRTLLNFLLRVEGGGEHLLLRCGHASLLREVSLLFVYCWVQLGWGLAGDYACGLGWCL